MPVGKLLTRLTNDVDALAEVFGSGAVGVLGDLVSLTVIATTMLLIEWRLGLLLLVTQVPCHVVCSVAAAALSESELHGARRAVPAQC
jgi:ATP-binding cassette subfamily B protein